MPDRFFAPDLTSETTEYHLTGQEARHLVTVLRGQVGLRIELFNGAGLRALGEIVELRKREALIRLLDASTSEPPPPLRVYSALPKGDRQTFLIEKCVELGVTRLTPLRTERSVTHPKGERIERFERTVTEACKQSGRDHLMQVDPLTDWKTIAPVGHGWLLDPTGSEEIIQADPPERIAVGPEGGWTEAELQGAQQAGWTIVRWPGAILRVETAVVAAVVVARSRT